MTTPLRAAAAGIVVALACAVLSAQQTRQTFRAATRLVEVPVIVTDRSGTPVEGLTRDDFVLSENWKAQQISLFEVIDNRGGRPLAPPAIPSPRDRRLFTNSGPAGARGKVVILLDRLNASFANQWYARSHVERYLEEMETGDAVALYVLDGDVTVLHDFTTDAASLRAALDLYQARVLGQYDASQELPPALAGNVPVWLADPSRSMSEFFTELRARNTFDALETLASHLAGIDGRKSVIWLSEVFAIPTGLGRADFMHRLRRATQVLSDAQVSLYPVDARGLIGALSSNGPTVRFTTFEQINGNLDAMKALADGTGGKWYWNTNALVRSMHRAVDDGQFMYLLGYYPTEATLDGRFRTIGVRVKTKGLTVRHRSGYVAAAPSADLKARDAALVEAARRPLMATQIALTATTAYDAGTRQARVDLRVDPAMLTLQREGTDWVGRVDVALAEIARNGDGTILTTRSIDVRLSDQERTRHAPITADLEATVTGSLHQLRVLALDVQSGRTGSLMIPATRLLR